MSKTFRIVFALPLICVSTAILALGQAATDTTPAAKPSAAPHAAQAAHPAAKPASKVDEVIKLVKSGMSEQFIIKSLQNNPKPVALSTTDLVRLKEAGVSEAIIGVMMDPKSTPAPAPAPPPAPAPAPVTNVPPPAAEPPSPAVAQALTNAQKKRVAVLPFDYSAVMTQVQAIFNTQANIGQGIRAMAQTRLAQDGKVVVVEREKIDVLLKEQDSAAGNRVKQGTGSRIGKISGADAILAGDIVVFGRDDKKKGGGIGALGRACAWCGLAGAAAGGFKKEEKAVVVINYRLIDAETSEIIATGEARGESKRSSMNWGAFAGGYNGAGAASFDMTSSNFGETIIGEATKDCVDKLVAGFTTQAEAMKKRVREVEAYVADITGGSMMISAGSNDGVNAGETFEIFRVEKEVKDPVTKEVIDRVVTKVGECKIASVRDRTATGSYSGSPAIVGMVARKKI
jgi:curli biogenesis system outer membrane secretion channel CsgG